MWRLIGPPLLGTLTLIAYLAPGYVPSDDLERAAASTADRDLARQQIVAGFAERCRRDGKLDPAKLDAGVTLYSWENDAGFLARTDIVCSPGAECKVHAAAMMAWPFPGTLGGKPIPTQMRDCD